MVPWMRALPAYAASLAVFALSTGPIQTPTQGIEWHSDLGAAPRLAAKRSAPLLVVFRCEA